jgi:hypothetical protein
VNERKQAFLVKLWLEADDVGTTRATSAAAQDAQRYGDLLSSLPPTPHDARFVLSEFERIAWNAMAAAVHVRLDSPGAVGTALCFHRRYGSLLRRRVASHQGLHRLQIGWRQRGLVGSYADMNSRAADSVRDSDHPDTVRLKDLGHC